MKPVRPFRRGVVYTGDPGGSWAETVAVRDGRILSVGTDEEMVAANLEKQQQKEGKGQ